MEPKDPNTPATIGDLHDLRDELLEAIDQKLDQKLDQKFAQQTLALAEEIAGALKISDERHQAMFRVASDETRAVSDRLDGHVADAAVHRPVRRRPAPRR